VKNPSLSELRQASERARQRLPRWLRWLLWCGGILALVCVLGFFVAPPILRGQLEKRLSEQLHRRVTLGKVRLNPLTLSVSLESFAVSEPTGGQFIGWRRLFVNFDAFSFLMREWRFQEIALDGFSGKVAVAKDGRLNFADLLESFGETPAAAAAPKADKKSWPLLVRRLAISAAQLSYTDASRAEPFATEVGPTSVSLRNFYTGGPKQAPGEFAATTESGETFAWRGTLSFAPLRSSGEVALGKIALKKYAPYYSDRIKFDLRSGSLDVALHYDFAIVDGKPSLNVSNGRVAIAALQIAKRGVNEPVIDLKQIELTGLAATYPKTSADIARVAVIGGSVTVQRTAEGLDLVELLMPVVPETPPAVVLAPAAAPAVAAPPIDAKVTEISIRDLAVTIEDRSTPRLARHELTELTCDLRNFSLATPAVAMPFGFKAKLAPEGVIHAAGTIALAPMKAEVALELNTISLANVSPYAETFVNLRIGKGQLTTALNLKLALPVGSAPVIAVQGDVSIDEFAAYDAASVDEIAGWRSLAIKGIEYSSAPAKLMIGEITWADLTGHLIVNADHSINLAVALQPPGASSPKVVRPGAPAAKTDTAEPMFIALDRLVLENASFEFVDRSLKPNVHVSLNELSGQIDGLASSDLARATVSLQGKVDGIAPVVVTGKINPLSAEAFTDLKVIMKAIELVPIGPYVGKFAGYELTRGSLNLDVKCHIAQRKVDFTNVVTIDQFTFGSATSSLDATKLPVRLAVALLRDTSGRIVLDVPVQGSLDDPNFRIGRVVLRVITNLLVKVATSPFSLIGSMFGGEKGQDLSFLQFTAGGAAPQNEAELKKLDVVARALLGRPTLLLEVVGGYDEVADGPALREQALENKMRNIIWEDRRHVEPDITLDQIQLDPAQKMGMVRRFYYKTFPNEAPRHASVTPAEPSRPVAGQRGNLGTFQRRQATISRPAPTPKPASAPPAGAETDGVITETSPDLPPTPKAISLDEMKAKLLERMTVDEEAYRQLADGRAQMVREYLVNQGQVPAERLSLVGATAETPVAKGARVDLRLK
jgi:hypothetical protein